jgi:integrase
MQKRVLTDRALKALKPAPAGKRYDVMDGVVPGLAVRVTDKGQRSFVLVARYPGASNPTRRALGDYGAITLEAAREKARDWIELIQRGTDPKHAEERERQAAARERENSFAAVAEDFIARHVSKTRKGGEVERDIRREFIGRWGDRPITDITRHDVIAVIDAAVDRGAPYQAHNLLGYVRRLFNWAIARGIYGVESSPCDRLRASDAIGPKKKRTRILNNDELRAFWKCTGEEGYPYGPLFRLLLVTGQRESVVCQLSRDEFNTAEKMWTLPAERVGLKSDDPYVVPLPAMAIDILKGLPEFSAGEFLFSAKFGKTPIRGDALSKPKRRLDAAMLAELRRIATERGKERATAKLPPWVLHDLRRTMRSGLSALPIAEHVRELVIGHVRPGISGVYDLYAYLDEKRQALELWAARVRDIVELAPANVIPIAGAASTRERLS